MAELEIDRDVPVAARGARKAEGRTTGAARRCTMHGCWGIRIYVRWPGGRTTYPCSKGMSRLKTRWKIL